MNEMNWVGVVANLNKNKTKSATRYDEIYI